MHENNNANQNIHHDALTTHDESLQQEEQQQQLQLLQDDNPSSSHDPELLQAFQIFANMSLQELMDTTLELREIYAHDPQALEEMEQVMKEVYKITRSTKSNTINGDDDDGAADGSTSQTRINDNHVQVQEEEQEQEHSDLFSMIMSDTLDMMRNANNEQDWSLILEQKDAILQAVIHSGFMTEEETEVYRRDEGAWEDQLRIIWEELRTQQAMEDL